MALAAGRLRHRVSLQMQVETQDPLTGEVTLVWQTQAQVWAAVEPLSGREFFAAQAAQSEVTARIVIRHRADIDATWRVLFRGKTYNVHAVLPDPVSGIEYITLPVSVGVNDGR